MIEKKITVKTVNQVNTLHVNDQPAPCPFRNPFFMPPSIQGAPLQMSVPVCNDNCPFFDYFQLETPNDTPTGWVVKLGCANVVKVCSNE